MLINQFIQQLANQLDITISQNEQGHACISLDGIVVDIKTHKDYLVFLTFIDHFSESTFEREEQLKNAMSWAFAWTKSHSSIATVEDQYAIQTVNTARDSFSSLLAQLNSHCQLVTQIQQLELQPIQHSHQHAYILP